MDESIIERFKEKKGMFCSITYKTSTSEKTDLGELLEINDDGILFLKDVSNGGESMIDLNLIKIVRTDFRPLKKRDP